MLLGQSYAENLKLISLIFLLVHLWPPGFVSGRYEDDDDSDTLPEIGGFGKQCGKIEPNQVDELYMIPQGYKCMEDKEARPKPKDEPKNKTSLRLNGGWSAEQSFKSFVVVNFEGKDKKSKTINWRCNGAFIDQSIILTSTSCSDRPQVKVSRVRVSVDGQDPVSVKRFCKLENLEKKPGTRREAEEFKNDITLLTLYQPIGKPACLDLDRKPKQKAVCVIVAEGKGSRNETTSSSEKTKSLFVSQECPSSIKETKLHPGETCYSRYDEGKLAKYNGNLCSMDTGAPVYCVDHCQFGASKLYLAGIVSTILPEDGKNASCQDGDENSKFSFVVTDMVDIKQKLLKMIDKCGSR